MHYYTLILAFLWIGCQETNTKQAAVDTTSIEVQEEIVEEKKEPPFNITSAYVMGKFDPAKDSSFVVIDVKYADRAGLYLRTETYEAFKKMHQAAVEDGIKLIIRSATRNFDYQKGIWERKWTGVRKVDGKNLSKAIPDPKMRALKILEQSSMPGTSRHHWGTDIDFNSFNNNYFEKGEGLKIYQWLQANAAEYGFCQTYSPKGEGGRPEGYNEEKWHWSYLPIAVSLTNFAKENLTDDMIKGFRGAEVAPEIGIVKKYVLGINPLCQQN
ncbi:MAG: M15 family metallopeptidase [Saprospiraceae bacterium]|nr:M15 family metallopeptidase [Saprospiraceae bacterium]